MQEELARKLRSIRGERGLSLRQAERVTGITRETLAALERGERSAFMSTLEKIAAGYQIPLESLVEPTSPARAWAAELGAELHGMSDEAWTTRLSGLATQEELAEAWNDLQDEAAMLRDALRLDKWSSASSGLRHRRELSQGLRDIRIHRFADLAAEASLLRAQELVDEIFAAMREESLA
jgi:transcriptional regulator with XRE-family HTH domain